MNAVVSDQIGLIHVAASVLALICGTLVLILPKGGARHRQIGYLYAASMAAVVVTAFLIYRLWGGFGVFHAAALVSGATLAAGMLPAILRKPAASWLDWHFSSMYWSVIGLYAALAAETLTRIPGQKFLAMVGAATFLVVAAGQIAFIWRKKKWQAISVANKQ